jgi:hypothetical protein
VGRLKEITEVLVDADSEDKRAVYAELGVDLTYQPDGTVLVRAGSPQAGACTNECVGGPTPTLTTPAAPLAKSYSIAP